MMYSMTPAVLEKIAYREGRRAGEPLYCGHEWPHDRPHTDPHTCELFSGHSGKHWCRDTCNASAA